MLDLKLILPETILAGGAILLLALNLLFNFKARALIFLSTLLLGASLLSLASARPFTDSVFSGMLIYDPCALFFKALFLFIGLAIVFISCDYAEIPSKIKPEFYVLILMVTAAMMFLAQARNLLAVYLGFELVSLISYVLAAYGRAGLKSSEAALKYFLFGTACSITMLYGMSLVYGITGTMDLLQISSFLFSAGPGRVILSAGAIMIMAGLAFKIAAAPMHFWCPDVYEGSPTPVTAFLSVGPKAAGFAVLLRFLSVPEGFFYQHGMQFLGALCILTMFVGNLTAISQGDIKRLLAYSSIAHAGYALIALVIGGKSGQQALFVYLVTYIIMNIGAFAAIIAVSSKIKSDRIKDYSGLAMNSPYLAAFLSVFLVSLAGIPPLAGFTGKLYIFMLAIKEGYLPLAVIAVINSVIAAYYYFNVIRVMYLVKPEQALDIRPSLAINFILILSLALTLAAGIYPKLVIDFAGFSPAP